MVFGFLLVPSFLAAFGEDEGTLPKNTIWMLFARLFYVLRFPTHSILWTYISKGGTAIYFGGLFINCCFYGILTERLFSILKPQKK